MDRAYSTLEIKGFDEDSGTITGIASTPIPDKMGDIVEPEGVKYQLPIPLLWGHQPDKPLGNVTAVRVSKDGIGITAKIALGVSEEIDQYWRLIKAGLVRGLSIGFRALDGEQIEGSWGVRFKSWEWLELSAVTIPAGYGATIATVKEYANRPAAIGTEAVAIPPGVSGKSKPVMLENKQMAKTVAEQISALESKRSANASRMEEIMNKSVEEGRSTDESEQDEFDTLDAEVKAIDADLSRFRALENTQKAAAKPVDGANSKAASESRTLAPVKVKAPKLDAGIEFARLARVKGLARLNGESVRELAKGMYGEDSNVYGLLQKAAVSAGTTQDGNWAANLVGDEGSVFADFVEFLRPMTILGKFGSGGIPGLRRVPFRVPLIGQTGGGQGYWVGEGKAKPLTAFDFNRTTLEPLKVANIAVVTEENLRDSSPSSDVIIRDSLAAALRERLDTDFIDPAKAAAAGVSPASVTNGVVPTVSGGNTADDVRNDIKALFGAFIAANNAPQSGVFIMTATTALALSLMTNPLGQSEFSGITMNGGVLMGLPVIVSEYVPTVVEGAYVALVNASDIYLADDGGIAVDLSREASLEMADNPAHSSGAPTGAAMVSMFQTNSVAFRAERSLNWAKRRESAVALLSEVTWGQ